MDKNHRENSSKISNKSGAVKSASGQKAERPKPKAISNPPAGENKSDITAMEVHHHPQLEHKAKPWKEYLLEGFMIFIAVMMGFIAENIREAIDNSEHAKQLTLQLVQDLKADTAQLNTMYRGETRMIRTNDSLFVILQQPLAKADTKRIQQLAINSHNLWLFHPSAGAIGAIKNELRLKQFSNSKIIGHISRYEGHIELLHVIQDIALQYQRNLLEPFLRQHFTPANLDAAFNHSSSLNVQMRNLTQTDLTQLNTDMVFIRLNSNELVRDNRLVEQDAVDLLSYVIKQYHLEDE